MSENKCTGKIEISDDGEFKLKDLSKSCKVVLKKINPVRGTFWKLHIPEEEKKKHKIED